MWNQLASVHFVCYSRSFVERQKKIQMLWIVFLLSSLFCSITSARYMIAMCKISKYIQTHNMCKRKCRYEFYEIQTSTWLSGWFVQARTIQITSLLFVEIMQRRLRRQAIKLYEFYIHVCYIHSTPLVKTFPSNDSVSVSIKAFIRLMSVPLKIYTQCVFNWWSPWIFYIVYNNDWRRNKLKKFVVKESQQIHFTKINKKKCSYFSLIFQEIWVALTRERLFVDSVRSLIMISSRHFVNNAHIL